MFTLSDASLSYGTRQALSHISLAIASGEKVALVGPSGAGKSSLLALLQRQHSDQIALCPQEHGLVSILSVYQNIYMGGLSRHSNAYNLANLIRPWARNKAEIQTIADRLGLGERLWASVDRLSGGQKQRVALGRALYRQQPVFFGDEPVSSLDPEQADELLGYVLSQHETAVVAIHNPEQALRHFSRVIAVRGGRIAGDWASSDISVADLQSVYLPA